MLSNPEMVRYIGNGVTRDQKGTQAFLEWIYSHYQMNEEFGLKVIVRKADNIPIGHAGIVPQQVHGKDELEVGYWISKDYWGNGYASESMKTFLHRGANELGIGRLISLIQPGNLASQKVALKNGMQLEKEVILSGQDVCIYSIKL